MAARPDFDMLPVRLELSLLADPDAPDWEATRLEIRRLRKH